MMRHTLGVACTWLELLLSALISTNLNCLCIHQDFDPPSPSIIDWRPASSSVTTIMALGMALHRLFGSRDGDLITSADAGLITAWKRGIDKVSVLMRSWMNDGCSPVSDNLAVYGLHTVVIPAVCSEQGPGSKRQPNINAVDGEMLQRLCQEANSSDRSLRASRGRYWSVSNGCLHRAITPDGNVQVDLCPSEIMRCMQQIDGGMQEQPEGEGVITIHWQRPFVTRTIEKSPVGKKAS